MSKRQELVVGICGIVLAVGAQAFVVLAEGWDLGPSVRSLHLVLGVFTWPVLTTLVVGVPIGAMFYAAARFTRPASVSHLALLVGPFAAVQMISLASAADVYTLAYALMFTATAAAGALAWTSADRRRATSR